jgi:hypothetical protein
VYDYGMANGVNDNLNRVETIGDGTTDFAAYDYLGAHAIAAVTQGNGVTNDLFAGWDRFGRTANMLGDRKRISMVSPDYIGHLSRPDARAVEQVFIERHGLSSLLNRINSIAKTNPIYNSAIERGQEILKVLNQ